MGKFVDGVGEWLGLTFGEWTLFISTFKCYICQAGENVTGLIDPAAFAVLAVPQYGKEYVEKGTYLEVAFLLGLEESWISLYGNV